MVPAGPPKPGIPYRDYYLWSDNDDDDTPPMFPGVEKSVWSWDDEAGQYYRHMFYRHEPDLNLTSPAVLKEIENIILFWLKLGVSGFRLDAATHLTRQAGNGDEKKGCGSRSICAVLLSNVIQTLSCWVKSTSTSRRIKTTSARTIA